MAVGVAFMHGMTVKDLRECLDSLPDDLPIFVSIDPEGNAYNRLYSVDRYKFDTKWMEPIDYDRIELHPEEYENNPDIVDAVIIWP